MKTIVFTHKIGDKPEIYSKERNLQKAKKILADKYMDAITNHYDEIVDGRDFLSRDGKVLELFNVRFFIEPNTLIE